MRNEAEKRSALLVPSTGSGHLPPMTTPAVLPVPRITFPPFLGVLNEGQRETGSGSEARHDNKNHQLSIRLVGEKGSEERSRPDHSVKEPKTRGDKQRRTSEQSTE